MCEIREAAPISCGPPREEYVEGRRGRAGGAGGRLRRAARRHCLRVPAAPPRSAAASDLHEGRRRASRVVAGESGAGRWRGGYTRGGVGLDWRVGSMCLRVPTARPRSTRRGRGAPQQATCTNGLRASRAVAGQAVGLHQNTTSGRGGSRRQPQHPFGLEAAAAPPPSGCRGGSARLLGRLLPGSGRQPAS